MLYSVYAEIGRMGTEPGMLSKEKKDVQKFISWTPLFLIN
ncbi:hypothetical protein AR1Y2_0158 [Anaerostipes rhamnosivorans]|uniref:Uncharacterized protein n=1 Tax=Anaerostipes rhamnosivorans TaxID=1229621 RepID=A0A4P8I823_9FIRM|nr:hypothetical protein AR1Y2_0158 [Anaerostipes rhamnosivorans]